MIILVRSMSPQVLATDEIGSFQDVSALEEVVNAGVSVLATIHGGNLEEVQRRPSLERLFQLQIFERFVILSRSQGLGTVEQIISGSGQKLLKTPIRPGGGR